MKNKSSDNDNGLNFRRYSNSVEREILTLDFRLSTTFSLTHLDFGASATSQDFTHSKFFCTSVACQQMPMSEWLQPWTLGGELKEEKHVRKLFWLHVTYTTQLHTSFFNDETFAVGILNINDNSEKQVSLIITATCGFRLTHSPTLAGSDMSVAVCREKWLAVFSPRSHRLP